MQRGEQPMATHQAPGSSSAWAQKYSVEATPLGRGSFATVHKAVIRETEEPVAIKVMTKARLGERALQMLAAEINILRTLQHPNVVCLRDSHNTERRILIVLEYCGGGDLGQFIQARGPSPESTARHFMGQLAAGLAFLRSRRLIHRDIKPQNLLLTERTPRATLKIADFGLARHLPQGSLAESMLGSPLYMAPEVLSSRAYDAKADLWSAGAVLFELLTAKHPFGGANQTELINNIRRNRPRLPPGVKLSASCIELLGMLLVPRPADRASLQMLLSCAFLNEKDEISNKESSSAHRSGVELASPARAAATGRAPQSSPPLHVPPSAGVPTSDNPRSYLHTNRDGFSPEKYRLTPQPSDPTLSRPSAQWRADGATRAGLLEGGRRGESVAQDTAEMAPAAREDGVEGPREMSEKLAANVEARSSMATKAAPQQRSTSAAGELRSAAESRRMAAWGWSWEPRTRGQGKDADGVSMLAGINDEGPLPSLPVLPFALEGPSGRQFAPGKQPPAVLKGDREDRGAIQAASDLVFDLAFAAGPAEHAKMPTEGVEHGERQGVAANDAVVMAIPSLEPCDLERNRQHHPGDDPAAHANASYSGTSAGIAGAQVMPSRRRDRCSGEDPASSPDLESPPAVGDDGLTRSSTQYSPDAVSSAARGASPVAPRASRAFSGSISSSPRVTPESPPVRLSAGAAGGHAGGQPEGSTQLSTGHCAGRGSGVRCDARNTLSDFGSGGGVHLSPPRVPSKALHSRQYHATPVVAGSQHSPGSPSSEFIHPQAAVGGAAPEMRGADGVPMVLQYPSLRAGGDSLLTIPEDSTGFVLVTRPSSMACEHGPHCDCMAWSAGGGGVASASGGLARSPSASYLAATNPYGGPGKTSANAERRQRTGGGGSNAAGPSFLGLGNIWTTAVNTFRGVAGANTRRNSWPRRGGDVNGQRAQQQQQQHEQASAFANVPPASPSVPGLYSPSASPTAVVGSLREHLSPHGAQGVRKMAGTRGSSDAGVGTGSPGNGSSSSGRNDSLASRDGNGGAGGSNRREVAAPSPSISSHRKAGTSTAEFTRHHGSSASPPDMESGRTVRYVGPRSQSVGQQQWQHHRRHSEPIYSPLGERPTSRQSQMFNVQRVRVAPSSRSQGLEGAATGGLGRLRWNQDEVSELRRVQVAAERAEVVGTRSILVVKLADKTAQEAMSLALESPRDARASESDASPGDGASHDNCLGRRHEMLTEALSLYVRALAMLQGTLPGVLVECEGVLTEGFAAWNPLGTVAEDQRRPDQQQQPQPQQQKQKQKQKQHKQDQQGPVRSKSPSSALLAQRSELVTKASRLKELFTQTLQRAEQCNDKVKAAAATLAAQDSCPVPSSGDDGSFAAAGRCHGALWATLASAGTGVGGPGMPSSDIAAAAVYRSAIEHGREAAVCYLLGRSDAAVEHYGRARALLQLLALEPEMAGAGAKAGGQKDRPLDGSPGSFSNAKSGWRAQLLLMADGYARRVELMSRGADVEGIEERVQGEGNGGKGDGL